MTDIASGVTRRSAMGMAGGSAAAMLVIPAATGLAQDLSPAPVAPTWGSVLVPPREPLVVPAGARLVRPVMATLAGIGLQIELANRFGTEPVRIEEITLGGEPALFGGKAKCTIPPGAIVLSDPVDIALRAGDTIHLSARFQGSQPLLDIDRRAAIPGWIEAVDATRTDSPESALFSTLYLRPSGPSRVIAIVSDTKSAGPGAWAELLAGQLPANTGVLNRSLYAGHLALGPAGLSGLARLERDVLSVPGVTDVLLFAGNNDLIQPGMIGSSGAYSLDPSLMQSTEDLVGYLAMASRLVRAAGMRAAAATWLPYEGVTIAKDYSTPEKQRIRSEVNHWLRTSDAFDWVVDFDARLRDPSHPDRLATAYDEGNHFTPNDAGYALMARAFLANLRG